MAIRATPELLKSLGIDQPKRPRRQRKSTKKKSPISCASCGKRLPIGYLELSLYDGRVLDPHIHLCNGKECLEKWSATS